MTRLRPAGDPVQVAIGPDGLPCAELYGAVEFWRAARERSIRPVIGAEVALALGILTIQPERDKLVYTNHDQSMRRGRR